MYLAVVLLTISKLSLLTNADQRAQLDSPELQLHRDLFKHYNVNIRPVLNHRDSITIEMKLCILAIDNVDEKKQTISVRVFSELQWVDSFLTWEPHEYGNVSIIHVDTEAIWMPDLSLKSTLDKPTDIGQNDNRAIINAQGRVTVWPYKVLNVGCKMNIKKYPFDQQKCVFQFTSWTHPHELTALEFLDRSLDLRFYQNSSEWDLTDYRAYKSYSWYANQKWDHLNFELTISRKWLFYAMNMLLPIVFISFLNVACFLLPHESGEKIALSISIFLTLTVFLTVVNSSLPESSDEVCAFGLYIGLQLIGNGLTLFFTVFSLYLFHNRKDQDTIPRVLVLLTKAMREAPTHKVHANGINGQVTRLSQPEGQLGTLEKSCSNPNDNSTEGQLTWSHVASALDRLFLWLSVCWHVLLFVSVIIAMQP